MPDEERPSVLIVDDEEIVAESYALWLSDEYDVRVANGGHEAIEQMDESVDVVLLDRRMPRMSGDEVLEKIHARGYDCRVAIVSAVDPDFDIVEMEFDDYLTKPVSGEDIKRTVEDLLRLAAYDDEVSEEVSLTKKQATLEARKSEAELDAHDQYRRLRERRKRLQSEVGDTLQSDVDDSLQSGVDDTLEERGSETLRRELEAFQRDDDEA